MQTLPGQEADGLELCDKQDFAPDYLKVGPKPITIDKTTTDTGYLIIFVVFQLISVIITIVALIHGDPNRLSTPYDPDHLPCGSGDRADYPYIYFPAPTIDTLYITVCVKECPSETQVVGVVDCFKNSVVTSCTANFSPEDASRRFLIYASVPHSGNLCLPTVNKYIQAIAPILSSKVIGLFVSDLKKSSMLITFAGFLALGIGYGLIHAARFKPTISAYTYVGCSILGSITLAVLFFVKYNTMISTQQIDYTDQSQPFSPQDQVKNIISNSMADPVRFQQMGIFFIILAVLIIISAVLKFSKLQESIDLIKASSKYIEDKSEILFIPVILFGVSFVYFTVWLYTVINLYSCGSISTLPKALPFGNFTPDPVITYLIVYQFFMFFWSMMFLNLATDFIVGSACSIWYFTRSQWTTNELPQNLNITKHVIYQFLRYHVGSVALGSILITCFKWIRDILLFFEDTRAKQLKNQDSLFAKLDKYMRCFHYLFNKFFIFLTEGAFIYVFLCRENFWVCCSRVTTLIWKDKDDRKIVERMSGFGELYQALGIICICFMTTMTCVLILQLPYYKENLDSAIAPTLLIMIISFIVGKYTMGILGAAADSILVVIQIDEEINGGSAVNCPQDLEIIFKKNIK